MARIPLLMVDLECFDPRIPNDLTGEDFVSALGSHDAARPFTNVSLLSAYTETAPLPAPPLIMLSFHDSAETCMCKFVSQQDAGPYCSDILRAAWLPYIRISAIRISATLWATLAALSHCAELTAPAVTLIVELEAWAALSELAASECRHLLSLRIELYEPSSNDTSVLRGQRAYEGSALHIDAHHALFATIA
ncbi:hypothetical protein AURDEDRAFT_178697 [Auricularia subglabra TFB-10046 SS5]|uniref:Uncharacterized protein n=1 Tax=Auricularia subglabra (strain TFB-10046 / SS5) TaxID=717982 RepID=J0WKH2_AURST|nr:hypothetical protein AURDEDRAFT_178697 [Auricularia subglabra TFB-10046 SS5]